jgi:hypothetical protein
MVLQICYCSMPYVWIIHQHRGLHRCLGHASQSDARTGYSAVGKGHDGARELSGIAKHVS